jgi:hypothetical protein
LGLTSMARGRHAPQTGQLPAKTQAIERAHAPPTSLRSRRAERIFYREPAEAAPVLQIF